MRFPPIVFTTISTAGVRVGVGLGDADQRHVATDRVAEHDHELTGHPTDREVSLD